ncbi:MAG: tetratricopeptide repeat protein, partial [Ktedonobacteraceae bacterium]|nr:tetratricopeptide repeat protein [Ktedonobacteraceae bacterium]
PDDSVAYYLKSACLCELERYEEALSSVEYSILLNPTFADAHYVKSEILERLSRYDEAKQAYTRACELGYTDD